MRNLFLLLLCTFILSCVDPFIKAETPDTYDPGAGWKLSWSDEFDVPELDMTKWSYDIGADGWGNQELQEYTSNRNNLFLTNGKLVIQALRSGKDLSFTSARIHTKDKFSFHYGKLAARIKLPYGTGIWPALWMMGTNKDDVGWPMCGEFDIVEMNGGGQYGDSIVFTTAHWYSEQRNDHTIYGQQEILTNPNVAAMTPVPFADDFHVFTMVWSESEIDTYFDDINVFRMMINTDREPDMAVYHQPFYLLLNLAVGGTMSKIYDAKQVPGNFPRSMTVDWIRVYQRENTNSSEKKK
jgi:beta-glucanase (GH16 family)